MAVLYHGDADGIASAALARHATERLGAGVVGLTPARGESVYDAPLARALVAASPRLAVILDTGARPGATWPVPTVVVDHPPTERAPRVEAFVHDPAAVATATMTLALLEPLADLSDRAWLAAVGALGDRGERARAEPVVAEATRRFGSAALREVVALVNAAGRASAPANEIAFEALSAAESPRALLDPDHGPAAVLRAKRREVADAVARCRRVPPRVIGRWAVIELHERCRVHGVVASAWARRLAPRIVLVANRGFVPGRVHLSVRSHEEIDLRAALRPLLPEGGADYAAGHARATGAILDVGTYEGLLGAIRREA